jgi:hypothetical protein
MVSLLEIASKQNKTIINLNKMALIDALFQLHGMLGIAAIQRSEGLR